MNSAVANRLKASTHERHRAIERLPRAVALSEGRIQPAEYLDYLKRLRVLVGSIDRETRRVPEIAATWLDGRRVEWIDADIAALGGADDRPLARGEAAERSPASIWGGLYVIEGSALGGLLLARNLAARADLRPALRYFEGYGTETAERWRRFRAALEQCVPESDLDEAEAAAVAMFERFGQEVLA